MPKPAIHYSHFIQAACFSLLITGTLWFISLSAVGGDIRTSTETISRRLYVGPLVVGEIAKTVQATGSLIEIHVRPGLWLLLGTSFLLCSLVIIAKSYFTRHRKAASNLQDGRKQ